MATGEPSNESRSYNTLGAIGNGDPGMVGGGTYTNRGGDGRNDPTIQDYENVFGPAARDIKLDLQRNKRHARWHLPDALKGANPYLTDRIDGLITDTVASPFTTILLPYKYIENVDAKIKWNVWSYDEGMASRVPYESAARTLTQTKRSYAGYTIRNGLAITMEHNFMMSEKVCFSPPFLPFKKLKTEQNVGNRAGRISRISSSSWLDVCSTPMTLVYMLRSSQPSPMQLRGLRNSTCLERPIINSSENM